MDACCTHCGKSLSSPWSFCPHCGVPITHPTHLESRHEHHPARGAFGGLLYGLFAVPILIIPGILLCLLGWGIFLGVPMIVMGILAPLVGPVFGMGEYRAKCPSCGTSVLTVSDGKVHDCPVCNRAFGVDGAGAPSTS